MIMHCAWRFDRSECKDLFRRSLFIVGEFGGNDYNSPLFAFKPLEEVHEFVPDIVNSIGKGIEKLIAEGAVELVVPGVLPIGCFPVYLSIFRKQEDGYGAKSGCIKDLNTLSWVHNVALQRKIAELRKKHAGNGVRIMYADYYTPAIQFVLHAEKWGESTVPFLPSPSFDRFVCPSSSDALRSRQFPSWQFVRFVTECGRALTYRPTTTCPRQFLKHGQREDSSIQNFQKLVIFCPKPIENPYEQLGEI
jgi:hypothetical protein